MASRLSACAEIARDLADIERPYNPKHRQSMLGHLSPMEFELQARVA